MMGRLFGRDSSIARWGRRVERRRGPCDGCFSFPSCFSRARLLQEGDEDGGWHMASTHTDHTPLGSKAAAISNHVVRTMSEYTGRGPTKGRTYINDDIVTVVLRDTLTKGERSLVNDDRDELVLTMRKAFQGAMRHDLVRGIEEILDRKVIAFMSDNHIDPDVAIEVFLLAPLGDELQRRRADTRGEALVGSDR